MQLEAHPSAIPNAEFEQLMARHYPVWGLRESGSGWSRFLFFPHGSAHPRLFAKFFFGRDFLTSSPNHKQDEQSSST
jgi:hypothetical protein